MGRLAILALRVVIVLAFAGLLFVQLFLMPVVYLDLQDAGRDVAHLRWGLPIIGVLFALAAEVALVAIWKLVTMVKRDTVFSTRAFRWVDVVIGCAIAATLIAVVLSFLLAPGEEVPPGMVMLVVIGGVGTALIALVVFVLRMLLAKAVALDTTATTLRAELDEVI
ncbi:DUF2975 domain-containing protein [Cellulomonas fimi]|uniref:DUF2975 domain-containing protein n=1 Tax=Cellulomonas fimi TaxID=1708 RepID=UPI0023588740|nr:DUF2975 domain-containing protein [Cellulomonas fimi]